MIVFSAKFYGVIIGTRLIETLRIGYLGAKLMIKLMER
jgi:hypothetical protein